MAFSVISNFTFTPALASEYAAAAFVENMLLLSKALGVVKTFGIDSFNSNLGQGGETIEMPYFANVASLISRRDLTATAAPSDIDVTGAEQKAIILRRKAGPVKFTEDIFIRGLRNETAEQEIGRQIGNYMALEARDRLLDAAIAGLGGITATPHTTTSYATSGTKDLLTYVLLHAGRMVLGDNFQNLTTVVMHSDVFTDLVGDALATYKIDTIGGLVIVTGIPAALGLRIVVCDYAGLKVTNGGSFKKYQTLLLGEGALNLIYAQALRIEAERRLDFEAPYWRVLGQADFAPHLHGMKWTGVANPANSVLQDPAQWDEAYNSHKEVRAALIVHNATAA